MNRLIACLKSQPYIIRTASVAIFFIWWEYAARGADPLFMTYPSAIYRAFLGLVASGDLQKAIVDSLIPFSIGLTLSIVGGILIGVLIGQFWVLEYILDPFISAFYVIPRIALIPLIILWAGLGVEGKIVIITSIAIFPVIIDTHLGIKDVRGSLIVIGRAYGGTNWQIFQKIILPASVPYIMAGVRLSVGLAIIGMVVAEFFTAVTGLGGEIVLFANNFATAKLFVPIIVIGILGVLLSYAVTLVERRFSRWRISEKARS